MTIRTVMPFSSECLNWGEAKTLRAVALHDAKIRGVIANSSGEHLIIDSLEIDGVNAFASRGQCIASSLKQVDVLNIPVTKGQTVEIRVRNECGHMVSATAFLVVDLDEPTSDGAPRG